MASTAKTAEEYLASLPDDRREALSAIRDEVLRVLPPGYEETMQYGMITYVVPHSIFPSGYHCKPTDALPFASLASQKQHMALYLHAVYILGAQEDFKARYLASGKKLDMGAACVRFKSLDDLPLDVVSETLASIPVEMFLAKYVSNLPPSKRPK